MTRSRAAAIVATIALGTALFTLFVLWPAQRIVDVTFDPYNYAGLARQMLSEGFAAHGLTKREASLYPAFIALVYAIAGSRPLIVTLLQCGIFAGTCALIVNIGARLFNVRTGLIAGLLFAIDPVPLRYVADLHMETLLTFAVTLNVWSMVRFHERPSVREGLLVGLTAGLATLTKGVAIVPPLVFGAYGMWRVGTAYLRGQRPQASPQSVVAIALATALVIAPWTARNYRVTGGRFVLIAPGFSDAFLRGYVFSRSEFALLRRPPYTDAENECNAWFRDLCRRAGTEFGRDEVRNEGILAAEATRKIIAEPGELARKVVVGLFTFWYQMTTRFNSAVTGGIALAMWGLAMAGWSRGRREQRPLWLLMMPIVAMNVFIAVLCSLGRYSLPIIPCLAVLAAFGVDTLLSARVAAQSEGVARRMSTTLML